MAALTTTALVALGAGSAISNYLSSRNTASGVEAQGKYEQQMLEQNASFADQQAKDTVQLAHVDELRHRAAIKGLIGTQRATMGAADIALDSGSARDIQDETQLIGEIDALTIRNNAARQAWGYQVEAANYRNQGRLARVASRNQAAGIRSQAFSTLLTNGAQIASMYGGGGGSSAAQSYKANYSGMTILNGRPVAIPRR